MREFVTRRGDRFQSPYTDEDALKRLEDYILNGSLVSDFGVDLCRKSKHGLSTEQMKWVHKLVVDHERKPKWMASETHLPRIRSMFDIAAMNLKWPKVRLTPELLLSLNSKREVLLTDGKSYRNAKFYGRISTDGRLDTTQFITDEMLQRLRAFDEDPEAYARIYGQRYSHCCFCGRELTNEASVIAGYGPICAEKYDLPWGDTRDPNEKKLESLKRKLAAMEADVDD